MVQRQSIDTVIGNAGQQIVADHVEGADCPTRQAKTVLLPGVAKVNAAEYSSRNGFRHEGVADDAKSGDPGAWLSGSCPVTAGIAATSMAPKSMLSEA